MTDTLISGIVVTALAGLIMGTSPWPLKLLRRFQYEHFAFVSMLVALVVLPWTMTFCFCPRALTALQNVAASVLRTANGFTLCWGIAQVLAMLCFIRIGVSLTYGILCSLGAAVGVVVPMIFKASGVFQASPDPLSVPGLVILGGVVILIAGVILTARAGAGRERLKKGSSEGAPRRGGFAVGLVMVIVAGVLSAGWGFAFAYSSDPIIKAATAQGASRLAANFAVWAFALSGAVLPNLLYPVWLLSWRRSWNVIWAHPGEIGLSVIYGVLFFAPCVLLGKGMILLGPAGASVGTGITMATLILGGQILGFVSGEWRGVHGAPRRLMYIAIVLLVAAVAAMAAGPYCS
jgi:L-rhamnose-H+ transport protein